MAFFRRRRQAHEPAADRPVVVERRRPGILTAITSLIGWIVVLIVVAILVIVFLL